MANKKKSHDPNFKVAETVGKAAEGKDSLLALNNQIQEATRTEDIFVPLKRICAAVSVNRKIITPGFNKIREGGTPDDFLNYATLTYVLRWQKQFTPAHSRKPVAEIHNWIPYINNTIRYCLINYNKEIQDYDFLPLPNHFTDSVSGETEETELICEDYAFRTIELKSSLTIDTIHTIITSLPDELRPFFPDILYYIRNKQSKMIDETYKNYIIIGTNLFHKEFCEWAK